MPRYNCSHMERYFRNVEVLFPKDHTGKIQEVWFWKKPATTGVRKKNQNSRVNAHWDARFHNDGNDTPVQRWSFYQYTARQSWMEDEVERGWIGDKVKIYLHDTEIANLANGIHEYCEQHGITTPYVIPYFSDHGVQYGYQYNYQYKVVSPWHLTHAKITNQRWILNEHGQREQHTDYRYLKTTPIKPALHLPEIMDPDVRLRMMKYYARGPKPDIYFENPTKKNLKNLEPRYLKPRDRHWSDWDVEEFFRPPRNPDQPMLEIFYKKFPEEAKQWEINQPVVDAFKTDRKRRKEEVRHKAYEESLAGKYHVDFSDDDEEVFI